MPATLPEVFAKTPEIAKAYEEVLAFARSLGPVTVEEKKTCIHVVAGKAAFLGVHPRKAGLRLTIVLSQPVDSKRIVKCEKASAKRFHIEVDVSGDKGLDKELKAWISQAYKRNTE